MHAFDCLLLTVCLAVHSGFNLLSIFLHFDNRVLCRLSKINSGGGISAVGMLCGLRQYGGCLDDKCASGLVGWLAKFRCVMLINKPVSCRPVWAARSTAAAAAEGVLLTCALRLARAGTGGSRPHLGTRYVTGNLDPRLWPDIGPNTGECITCVGRRCHPSPRRCVNNELSGGMLFPTLSVRSVSKPHSYPQQFFTPYIAYRISSALYWCIGYAVGKLQTLGQLKLYTLANTNTNPNPSLSLTLCAIVDVAPAALNTI